MPRDVAWPPQGSSILVEVLADQHCQRFSPLEYAPLIRLCDSWSRVFPDRRLPQISIPASTSATSAASIRKLFLPLFFTGVFPKQPAVLASLTYPRASI